MHAGPTSEEKRQAAAAAVERYEKLKQKNNADPEKSFSKQLNIGNFDFKQLSCALFWDVVIL